MYVIVWERAGGGGGHQVALTEDRAEVVHRAICRALPEARCRVEPAQGFGPPLLPGEVGTPRRRQEQRPRRASRKG